MILTITIGKIAVSSYWTMLVMGMACMALCLLDRRSHHSLAAWQCILLTLLLTVVGFTGAKLLYIFENLQDTLENGISLGGVSFFGSVYLIPLLMPLVGRVFRLKGLTTMDLCGPCVALMIASMRFGCLFSGCCGGWEVCIGSVCFTWPTQIVEIICDVAIYAVLMHWERLGRYRGGLYPMFMVLYSGIRFIIEFFRDTPKDWFFLSHGQWFSLAAIAAGAVWLALINRAEERSPGYEK